MAYFESDSQDEVLHPHGQVLDPHGEEHRKAMRIEP